MLLTQAQRVRKLYKTIAKLHRGLPPEIQALGVSYARDEFKRHKTCTPAQAAIFMSEWTEYALTLSKQLGLKGLTSGSQLGKTLNEAKLEDFQDQQIQQLYELMLSSTNQSDGDDKQSAS